MVLPYCNWVSVFFNQTCQAWSLQFAMCIQCWSSIWFECQLLQCWAPTDGHFEGLQKFCGRLATMFPKTTLVKANFFVDEWENNNRQNLTNFSYTQIVHAKQYKIVRALVWLHARGFLAKQHIFMFNMRFVWHPCFPILTGGFDHTLS